VSTLAGKTSILVADDDVQDLRILAAILERAGYEARPVPNGRLAVEAAVVAPPDLALLDVRMPEMSGLDVCRWFRQDERLRELPVIFVSALDAAGDKVEGFRAGGVDYVTKPFHEEEVLARVRTHLRLHRLQRELHEHNVRLEQRILEQVKAVTASQMSIIFALAKLAETRDDDTGRHIERVQTFSRRLAERMREMGLQSAKLTDAYIEHLYQCAALHDIGKVGTRDAVLLKPGKLTPEEFDEMKRHCALGAETLAAVLRRYPDNQFLRMGVDVARSHHERWDGTGYPDGLQGQAIPLAARIVSLADVYDALSSARCYRPAFPHPEARRMIVEAEGRQFDPDVVAAFRALEDDFRRTSLEMQSPPPPEGGLA